MSIEYSWETSGFEELEQAIDRLDSEVPIEVASREIALAQKIVKEIKDKYVPVYIGGPQGKSIKGMRPISIRFGRLRDKSPIWRKNYSGVLRDSVDCDKVATIEQGDIVVTIFAGRPGSGAEEYAAIQHENLMFKHRVGQAKYIEVPVNLIGGEEITSVMTGAIESAFGRFVTYAPGATMGSVAETPSPGGTGLL